MGLRLLKFGDFSLHSQSPPFTPKPGFNTNCLNLFFEKKYLNGGNTNCFDGF